MPVKLSPYCLSFFSETLWTCIAMEEAGVALDRDRLTALEVHLLARIAKIEKLVAPLALLVGKGSQKSQDTLLQTSLEEATKHSGVDLLSHPALVFTPKQKKLSRDSANRGLLLSHMPRQSARAHALRLIDKHTTANKLVGSFTFPLLRHDRVARKDVSPYRSIAIPTVSRPGVGIMYPSWFVVPTFTKNEGSGSGGTKQGRVTCKNHPLQTWPSVIKECQCSRWPGGVIVGGDLSQIELRIAALCSGEPSMVSEYAKELTGGKPDLHAQMATSVFGSSVTADPHWRDGTWLDPRQWGGKTPNFLILYRGGPDKYQETVLRDSGRLLDMPLCQKVVLGARAARPVLWAWQDSLIAEARRYGYLLLPLTGHSRIFLPGSRDAKFDENEICNFKVQTLAGLVQLALQHTLNRLLSPWHTPHPWALMLSNVYDAVYFDLRDPADLPRLKALFAEALAIVSSPTGYWGRLCTHYGRTVPLSIEVKAL